MSSSLNVTFFSHNNGMEGEVVDSRPTECKYAYNSNIKKIKEEKKIKKKERKTTEKQLKKSSQVNRTVEVDT